MRSMLQVLGAVIAVIVLTGVVTLITGPDEDMERQLDLDERFRDIL